MSNLNEAYARATTWFETLGGQGIDLTTNGHLKVRNEAIEFAEDPSLEEAADVFISLVGALHQRGWGSPELAAAVVSKMTVNEKRSWAISGDGTYQHV